MVLPSENIYVTYLFQAQSSHNSTTSLTLRLSTSFKCELINAMPVLYSRFVGRDGV